MDSVKLIGMLEMEVIVVSLAILMSNVAFISGSSKQGNAFLASVGSNCVTAKNLEIHITNYEYKI